MAEGVAAGGDDAESDDENGGRDAVENDLAQRVHHSENSRAEKGGDDQRREVDWLENKKLKGARL